MNIPNNNRTEGQISPWVKGLIVLGWSLGGTYGALSAAKNGSLNGWGLLLSCQMMVFIHAGWSLEDMYKQAFRDPQLVLLTIGVCMSLSFGGLIISLALR